MNIIVGLGNPGDVYRQTRHNAGFEIIDNLTEVMNCPQFSLKKQMKAEVTKINQTIFVKPQTFMNGSGFAVKAVADYFIENGDDKYKNLYVIHDDLDISLGNFKIKYGSGPIAHNGLMSIYQHLGTKNFWHVRVGIDTRDGERNIEPQTYVLQKFTLSDADKFNTVKTEVVKQLMNIVKLS